MKKLSEALDLELVWEQPTTFKQEYRLFAGEEPVARLDFRSSFNTWATGESGDGCWTFQRVGFFQRRVVITECVTEREVAVFSRHAWRHGGTFELPDGRRYPVDTNFWLTQLYFCDQSDEVLVRFHKIGGFLHLSSQVEVLPPARLLPEMPLMVLLGWYLTILNQRDSAAASAAVAASGD
jgi:hypothetical protein